MLDLAGLEIDDRLGVRLDHATGDGRPDLVHPRTRILHHLGGNFLQALDVENIGAVSGHIDRVQESLDGDFGFKLGRIGNGIDANARILEVIILKQCLDIGAQRFQIGRSGMNQGGPGRVDLFGDAAGSDGGGGLRCDGLAQHVGALGADHPVDILDAVDLQHRHCHGNAGFARRGDGTFGCTGKDLRVHFGRCAQGRK